MQPGDERGAAANDPGTLEGRIRELQREHRELDQAIIRYVELGQHDELQLQRLKKRKLFLKDSIHRLEMGLVPDIPA